jgi:uncharacterized protein YjiK
MIMQKLKQSKLIRTLIMGLFIAGIFSCDLIGKEKKQLVKNSVKLTAISYDYKNPDTIYQLPGYLKEISGISYFGKNKIACIQDEEAKIYIFDIEKAKVISEFDFGKKGDYEDIAIVGKDAYILKSDGDLFKIKNFETNHKNAVKIETPLNQKNDAEGLCYDRISNSLLIACKNLPSIQKEKPYDGNKAIYRFNLKTEELIKEPAFLIDFSKIDQAKEVGTVTEFFTKTAIKLGLSDGSRFFPSAIGIHPAETNKIYVLSSIGKMLIIMNQQENTIEIIELDRRLFNQPEGISFSENGDLYISNEGINGGGNILKFKPIYNSLKKN